MQTDRRTNMTKLIIAFRNFANAPKHRIAMNSIMCALQQIRQPGKISKDGMSVGQSIACKF